MFTFTRGATDYEIKYVNYGDDDLLVCQYEDAGDSNFRAVLDTYDLTNVNGLFYNDEVAFLELFLNNLNNSLDAAHGDGDEESENPQERLTALISNNLSFNGKHVILS